MTSTSESPRFHVKIDTNLSLASAVLEVAKRAQDLDIIHRTTTSLEICELALDQLSFEETIALIRLFRPGQGVTDKLYPRLLREIHCTYLRIR